MAIDGSDLRQLTSGGGNSHPSITPDGDQVIYRHSGEDGNSIWSVSSNGGEAVKIINKDLRITLVSPDGKFLAAGYAVDGKEKLAVFSIEGGEPVKLFDIAKTYNFHYWLRWSPDGKFISYPDGANGIRRQSLGGGDPARIEYLPEDKTFAHAWSRDGKWLAFGRVREVRDAVLITDFR